MDEQQINELMVKLRHSGSLNRKRVLEDGYDIEAYESVAKMPGVKRIPIHMDLSTGQPNEMLQLARDDGDEGSFS